MRDSARAIEHNRRAHASLGAAYDARHEEIFNATEQDRLRGAVQRAVAIAAVTGRELQALDVGCGTGNVTAHLIAAGVRVTPADLAPSVLDLVCARFAGTGGIAGTLLLNGTDLRPAADGAFDVVTAYSVLHHVSDYTRLVREMARVTARGGVVLIDHERTDASWSSADYVAFLREAVTWPRRRWWYWLQPGRYWKRISPYLEPRRWLNPRWMPEGDLHVWPDDHVEWAAVEQALAECGCTVVARESYLHFEPRYARDVWERWRLRCSDMQLIIARKDQ
jgi:ubiquinone/menaquinone biosynthesis C-methylase UbiE